MKFTYKDIYVSYKDDTLKIGNSKLLRVFDCKQGVPRTISLLSNENKEFIASPGIYDFDFALAGFHLPGGDERTSWRIDDVEAIAEKNLPYEAACVKIYLKISEQCQQIEFIRTYTIYPDFPALSVESYVKSMVVPCFYWTERNRELFNMGKRNENVLDSLCLQDNFKVVKTVEFQGRTDCHNQPVIEYDNPTGEEFTGGILYATDGYDYACYLQEASPSSERRDIEKYDFRFDAENRLFSNSWGIIPHDIKPGKSLNSYRHVFFTADSEAKSELILKQYLGKRFPLNIDRDCSITVNPWGGGSLYEKINEKFLLEEVSATNKIGAETYQIDDGYQQGGILRNLTKDNIKIDKDFWQISPENFPDGFNPLCKKAAETEIELALWFAPSCNREFCDWEESVDILYEHYKRYNIRIFKLDGIRFTSKTAEDNFRSLIEELSRRCKGNISFNFDVTNGQRGGYHLFLEHGIVFLENRYVYINNDLPKVYHPERTLRNLWNLSRYMRTQSLQIEVPSPEQVDYEFYKKNNISSPNDYPVEYWLGISIFANPLIWLAPSELSTEMQIRFKTILSICKKYRNDIFTGEIYPIGNMPDGKSICGFISWREDCLAGFLIIFREKKAPENAVISLPIFIKKDQLRLKSFIQQLKQHVHI